MKLKYQVVSVVFIVVTIILISDMVFSLTNYYDVYEPMNDQQYSVSPKLRTFTKLFPFQKIVVVDETPKFNVVQSTSTIKDNKPYMIEFVQTDNSDDPYDKEVIITKSDGSKIFSRTSPAPIYEIWESKSMNKILTKPVFIGKANIANANYKFVLDNCNQFWLEQYSKFQRNSPKVSIEIQNVIFNQLFLERHDDEQNAKYFYVDYQKEKEDSTFLFLLSLNPYQALLYQKVKIKNTDQENPNSKLFLPNEVDLIKTFRLQIFRFYDSRNPVLVWEEVKLIRKPKHLWCLLNSEGKR